MATQVVIFSVLLFGMSGVVLDFGRVYSEHSRMQAFTDQAALAAASELDGKTDSIARAVDAVFTDGGDAVLGKDGIFSTADGRIGYNISHLFFVRSISDETGPQYNLGDDLTGENLLFMATPASQGDPESEALRLASTQAKYVIAVGEERSVRNTLLRLINSTSATPVGERQRIRTISAAKHRKVSTGRLSNLVVCNPWENDPARSFESEVDNVDNVGIHFHHVADGTLSRPNSLARRIDTQLMGVQPVEEVCLGDPLDLPGYNVSMSADEVLHARVVCMLAAAEQEEFAVSDEVAITPVSADEAVTALSTIFDMWDAPISGVVEWDRDADGKNSQEPGFNVASASPNRSYSTFFQPDLNIMKGRVWREDLAITNLSDDRPLSSRLNFPRMTGVTDKFELIIHKCVRPNHAQSGQECLTDSTGAEFDWISEPARHSQVLEYYAANFSHQNANVAEWNFSAAPTPDEAPNYATAWAIELNEWHHAERDYMGAAPYDYDEGDPLTLSGEDASLSINLEPQTSLPQSPQIQTRPAVDADGNFEDLNADGSVWPADPTDIEPAYSQYTYDDFDDGVFVDNSRRLMDVTVVNCNSTHQDSSGRTIADVVGFAQVYILTPPIPVCPDGGETCLNRDLLSGNIYSEFVRESDVATDGFAVLVR